jgi:hypothetical protein
MAKFATRMPPKCFSNIAVFGLNVLDPVQARSPRLVRCFGTDDTGCASRSADDASHGIAV